MNEQTIPVIDCHVHFHRCSRFHYPIFPQRSAGFEALVGDYSALPRHYLPKDYAADTGDLHIKRTVWAEWQRCKNLVGSREGLIASVAYA